MKTNKTLLILLLLSILLLSSCEKRCRCYRYNGTAVIFSEEELDALDQSCTSMQDFDLGLVYSYCDWVY